MAEEKKKESIAGNAAADAAGTVAASGGRPNRDAYAKMFAEDYPDVDFEDKEARYGKMVADRENYRTMLSSNRKLTENLDKHRWLGAMFQDLANDETGELDPITWMLRNGIDVQQAIENEKYRKEIAEGLRMMQEKHAAGEAAARQRDENLKASAEALDQLSQELSLSDEQCNRLWNHMFENVIVPGSNGEISKDTWKMALHAMNYDQDIANAREEAGMQARNEKIQNRVKRYNEPTPPPTFTQGRGQTAAPRPKRKSASMDFDEMKKYGY